jgi:hypothetical protein
MLRLLFLSFFFLVGCCCQRQMTVGAKFDPYNEAKPVESVNVQVVLTR